jgi:hypothetical protein
MEKRDGVLAVAQMMVEYAALLATAWVEIVHHRYRSECSGKKTC